MLMKDELENDGLPGSQEERFRELERVLEEYKDKAGSLITVLHKAQEIFGYLP
jgi:NADH:ubiquinone oxidoreductase subunit E